MQRLLFTLCAAAAAGAPPRPPPLPAPALPSPPPDSLAIPDAAPRPPPTDNNYDSTQLNFFGRNFLFAPVFVANQCPPCA